MNSNKESITNKNEGMFHFLLPLITSIACVVIAVIAIWHISGIKTEYKVASAEYDALYDTMPFGPKDFQPKAVWPSQEDRLVKTQPDTDRIYIKADPEEVAARLNQIAESFNDVIGWIDFDSLPISYPLLQGKSNMDYLRVTYKGTRVSAGSIFLESLNNADFSDQHIIIYGHNMKDGSMFGQLKKYESPEFLEANKYFTIYAPAGEAFRYEIISCMLVSIDSIAYKISFSDDDEYSNFLQMLGYKGSGMPQSITLSTCAGNDKNLRRVVHAVRTDM